MPVAQFYSKTLLAAAWNAYYLKGVLMDLDSRAIEKADDPGAARPVTARDFLADLLTATVVKRESATRTLKWQKQLPPGRIEYQAKIPGQGRAIYVTVGTDQELNSRVVRLQLRGPARAWDPNRMDKVLEVYDLDVTSDSEARETFNILRQAIASQVAASERQPTARVSQDVEMRAEIGADEAAIMQQYFASADEDEIEE